MTPHFLAKIGFAILLCYVFLQTYAYLALLLIGYIGYKYSKRLGESRIDANGRGVLVTGCDTGED